MGYTVEKISGNQVKINFEIPAEDFDAAIQKAYLKMRGKVQLPGFRKGHAPRKVIEQYYGENVFYEDAFDIVFPDHYEKAVTENSLNPVDRPELDNVDQMGAGKELKFSVKVFVKPDVTLGQYKGLKATKYVHQVTDEEIENRIDRDVEKETTTQDVEDRTIENGDIVNLDYEGTTDGVAFNGGTAKGQTLEIGSNTFIPGFEAQMIGMAIGEEKDLNVTFPEEYHVDELKGKAAVFHVKVNGVQVKVKPALDDEFAQDVSDAETFDDYKAGIVKELTENAEKNADVELENNLIQQAVDAADCDIPQQMILDEIDVMIRELRMRMAYQGLRYEDYLKYTGQTEDQVADMYKPEAGNRVKMQLVLEAICNAENAEATEEDLAREITEEAERAGKDAEAFKASLSDRQLDYLRDNARIRKMIDLIKSTAEITVKDDKDRIDAQQVADDMMQVVEDEDTSDEKKDEE